MIINGLEELTNEEIANIDLDFIQDIIYLISQLEPVNSLGNTIHIGNISQDEYLTFELDNGKELMEISVNEQLTSILIRIDFDNHAIQYNYDKKKKIITGKDTFLQNDEMVLKYRYNDYQYYFELYVYEPIFDLTFDFRSYKFDVETFVKKLFNKNINFDEIFDMVPKEDLTVTMVTENKEETLVFKDNKLINKNEEDINVFKR